MDRERSGGWVCIMADRYRGAMYVGVTAQLAARVYQHRAGHGSDFCAIASSGRERRSSTPIPNGAIYLTV